jgi:hypothetical protein
MMISIRLLCVTALVASYSATTLAAAPPDLMNYQGVLRNALDKPLNGSFDMVFRFYDSMVAGNEILVDGHFVLGGRGVDVTGGLFNVYLGSGDVQDGLGPGIYTSLGQVFRDFSEVYLQVEVQHEVLSPRTRIVSSAYALNAASPSRTKAAGTVTLHGDTTTHSVDFADISFSANELKSGDHVVVHIWGVNQAANLRVIQFMSALRNTTADPLGVTRAVCPALGVLSLTVVYFQNPDASDTLEALLHRFGESDQMVGAHVDDLDSDDVDILSSAFDIRLNFMYNMTDATNATTIRYTVEIVSN